MKVISIYRRRNYVVEKSLLVKMLTNLNNGGMNDRRRKSQELLHNSKWH